MGSRLELRQREIESKELEFDMIKTKALNEFKGDVSISFGLIGDNSHLNKVYNNPTQNPRVSISFAVPIFDWGEKKARIKAQKMAQRINELETQLSNKKITYTQALINYRIELLNLKILSLYDFDKNIPLVPMKDIIDKK